MNGSKSSSRCNPEVSTLPIQKSSLKIEGFRGDQTTSRRTHTTTCLVDLVWKLAKMEKSLYIHTGENTSQPEELSMNYSYSRPMMIHIRQQSTDSLTIRNEILDKYRQFNAENGLKHVNELPSF